ncbi:MAG: FG-GAP-like repeat-containing protein [Deltaproteobacteria bacterium]|nr:FG-GAP-like repeat-containing protein [Deltaproteobacteria bacterium]
MRCEMVDQGATSRSVRSGQRSRDGVPRGCDRHGSCDGRGKRRSRAPRTALGAPGPPPNRRPEDSMRRRRLSAALMAAMTMMSVTARRSAADEVSLAGTGPAPAAGQAAPATSAGPGLAMTSGSGEYATSVTFAVPAYHGLEPELGLAYSSGGGGLEAGVGWAVTGGSAITRGSVGHGAARFDANDRFFLDGEELIPCATTDTAHVAGCQLHPPSGEFDRYYATQTDHGARIRNDGGTWSVWSADGVRRDYARVVAFGNGAASQWLLSAVTDLHGNTVTYEYASDAMMDARDIEAPRLSRVTYGGYAVELTYRDSGYVEAYAVGAGDRAAAHALLANVVVRYLGAPTHAYGLQYATSPVTGRPLLTSVQQYGNDVVVNGSELAGPTLPPTTFGYESTLAPGAASPTVAPMYVAEGLGSGRGATGRTALPSVPLQTPKPALDYVVNRMQPTVQHETVDLDGDGRMDHVIIGGIPGWEQPGTPTPHKLVQAFLAQADGTYAPLADVEVEASAAVTVRDLDGDGRTAIAGLVFDPGTRQLVPDPSDQGAGLADEAELTLFGDVNGDGCADAIVRQHGTTVALGDCRGGFGQARWTGPAVAGAGGDTQALADVNGDGRTDVLAISGKPSATGNYGLWFIPRPRTICTTMARTNDLAWTAWGAPFDGACTETSVPWWFAWEDLSWQTGDVNGDGFADVVATSTQGLIAVQLSNGDGTFRPQTPYYGVYGDVGLRVVDFDRDGRADIVGLGDPVAGAGPRDLRYTLHVVHSVGDPGLAQTRFEVQNLAYNQIPYRSAADASSPTYGGAWANQSVDYVDHDGDGDLDVVVWGVTPGTDAHGHGSRPDTRPSYCSTSYGANDPNCAPPPECNPATFEYCTGMTMALTPTVISTGDRAPTTDDWHRLDVNGDGRVDLVRLSAHGSDQLRVETRARNESGGFSNEVQDLALGSTGIPLGRVEAADVDGDGRTDLVAVDAVTATQVHTWTVRAERTATGGETWRLIEQDTTLPIATPVAAWRAVDVTGDGKDDLVNVAVDDHAHAVQLVTLPATGTGFGAPIADVRAVADLGPIRDTDLQVLDVNGDGALDLAGVFGTTDGATSFSLALVSARDGHFTAVTSTDQVAPGAGLDPQGWRAVDLDGDGRSDLGRISLQRSPSPWGDLQREVVVDAMLSRGDGQFRNGSLLRTTDGGLTRGAWKFADADGDGRTDVVRATFVADSESGMLVTQAFHAGADGLTLEPQATQWAPGGLPYPLLDRLSLGDLDGNGTLDAEFLDFDRAMWDLRLYTTHFEHASDRLTQLVTTSGSTQTVQYAMPNRLSMSLNDPVRGCQLGGVGAVVVATTLDAGWGTPALTSTTSYDCPMYRPRERRFLGWQQVTAQSPQVANLPQTTTVATYAASEACGALPVQTQTTSTSGTTSTTTSTYAVAHAAAPVQCVLTRTATTATDALGESLAVATEYGYDGWGRPWQTRELGDLAVDGDGTVTTVERHDDATTFVSAVAAETVRDESGRQLAFTQLDHDGFGQVIATHAWLKNTAGESTVTTTAAYDVFGNQILATDATGSWIMTVFESNGLFPGMTINALGHTARYTWDAARQLATSAEDPNGAGWVRTYDNFGRVAQEDNLRGGVVTRSYGFNAAGPYVQTQVDGLWSMQFLDALGRPRLAMRPSPTGAAYQETTYSDLSNQPATVSDWYDWSSPAHYTAFAYGLPGGISTVTRPDGTVSRLQQGVRQTIATDEDGHEVRTRIAATAAGARVDVLEPHGNGWATTRHEYDVLGRLVRDVDPAGNEHRLVLDSFGRIEQELDADLGATSFTYDAAGDVLTQTDARGVTLTATYDALHRPITQENSQTDRFITLQYDEASAGAGVGRLTSVLDTDANCMIAAAFTYDADGNPLRETRCWDGRSATLERGFDDLGRLAWTRYPGGEVVNATYDALGMPQGLTGYVTNVAYDVAGRPIRTDYANGTSTSATFSPARGWLDRLEVTGPTGLVFAVAGTHDAEGALVASTRTSISPAGRHDTALGYAYDAQHRLTAVTGDRTEGFAYDLVGNLQSQTGVGSYTYPAAGGLHPHAATTAGTKAFTYDAMGNLLTEHQGATLARRLVWNAVGLPETVSVTQPDGSVQDVHYAYAYDGARVSVATPTTTRLSLLPEVELELTDADGAGPAVPVETRVHQYTFGGRVVARRTITATGPDEVRFLHQDALGSSAIATDAAGVPVAGSDVEYTAFGRELGSSHAAGDHGFTGQRHDAATSLEAGAGLVYMNARYYDPATARFISADTIVPGAGVFGLNRYAYVGQNPISFTDPTGHKGVECVDNPYCSTVTAGGSSAKGKFETTVKARRRWDQGAFERFEDAHGSRSAGQDSGGQTYGEPRPSRRIHSDGRPYGRGVYHMPPITVVGRRPAARPGRATPARSGWSADAEKQAIRAYADAVARHKVEHPGIDNLAHVTWQAFMLPNDVGAVTGAVLAYRAARLSANAAAEVARLDAMAAAATARANMTGVADALALQAADHAANAAAVANAHRAFAAGRLTADQLLEMGVPLPEHAWEPYYQIVLRRQGRLGDIIIEY